MTFQEWYEENADRMWNHLNGDEIAQETWEAAQFDLLRKIKQLEEENNMLHQKLFGSKIDKVIERFDFEKVHKTMVALNWTWRDEGVPTIKSMKETARKLLQNAAINEFGNIFTGGFYAKRYEDGELELSFIVNQSHSHEDY